MPYLTPDTAITGNFITAADGNRRRDNDEYFKGRAGAVAIENALTVSGTLAASSTISTPTSVQAGPGPGNQVVWHDRESSVIWLWYSSGNVARLYSAAIGDVFSINHATGAMSIRDIIDNFIVPGRLHQTALTGFLRAGTWSYGYNADGTIAYQVMNAAGPLNGCAITYEYSGGRISAQRLRIGGTGGTVIASIAYGYDGSGRINSEAHS